MDTIAIIVRKSELMKHKRDDHVETVKKCENYKDGTCRYSCVYCWFLHENDQNKSKNNSESNALAQMGKK